MKAQIQLDAKSLKIFRKVKMAVQQQQVEQRYSDFIAFCSARMARYQSLATASELRFMA